MKMKNNIILMLICSILFGCTTTKNITNFVKDNSQIDTTSIHKNTTNTTNSLVVDSNAIKKALENNAEKKSSDLIDAEFGDVGDSNLDTAKTNTLKSNKTPIGKKHKKYKFNVKRNHDGSIEFSSNQPFKNIKIKNDVFEKNESTANLDSTSLKKSLTNSLNTSNIDSTKVSKKLDINKSLTDTSLSAWDKLKYWWSNFKITMLLILIIIILIVGGYFYIKK